MSLRDLIQNGPGAPAAHAHQTPASTPSWIVILSGCGFCLLAAPFPLDRILVHAATKSKNLSFFASFLGGIQKRFFAPATAHQRTNHRKSLLCSCATVAVVAILFALPAYCLAANSGDENRRANSSASVTDATADATKTETKTANQPTVAHPLAINTEIYPDDAEPPSVAPGASAPGTFAPVGALPLVAIAREPAPARRCFLVVPGLCAAAKNKPIVALATIQTAALIADGVTTRQYLKRGYIEVDPLTRILIGRRPTWARMAPLGTLQVFAGMWLAQRMETSRHPWIRRLWWLPQVIGITGNAAATANNVTLR